MTPEVKQRLAEAALARGLIGAPMGDIEPRAQLGEATLPIARESRHAPARDPLRERGPSPSR